MAGQSNLWTPLTSADACISGTSSQAKVRTPDNFKMLELCQVFLLRLQMSLHKANLSCMPAADRVLPGN